MNVAIDIIDALIRETAEYELPPVVGEPFDTANRALGARILVLKEIRSQVVTAELRRHEAEIAQRASGEQAA